jgi:hypothetical protein
MASVGLPPRDFLVFQSSRQSAKSASQRIGGDGVTLTFQSDRDWSTDEPSAVIFGIVCGWHEVLPEVAEKFDWTEEKTDRLGRLRARFVAQCPAAAED